MANFRILCSRLKMKWMRGVIALLAALTIAGTSLPLAARQGGEMPAPAAAGSGTVTSGSKAGQVSGSGSDSQGTTLAPPSMPVEEIIQKFAAKEAEFRAERENFTYTQTFICQTLDESNRVDGEYRMTSDITFDSKGKRVEVVTNAPMSTLERVELTQEDFNDLEHVYPFVLTTEELPKYTITYAGHVQIDELTTYMFDVKPKTMEKNARYFQGRIWVDDKDLQIVKTFGRPVGNTKKRGDQEQLFPQFETFRENIEGRYWFPTYSRANDVLNFRSGPVHLRVTVRYENYKRFGVTVKIGAPAKVPESNEKK